MTGMASEALTASAIETIARNSGLLAGRAGGNHPTLLRAPHDFADSRGEQLNGGCDIYANLDRRGALAVFAGGATRAPWRLSRTILLGTDPSARDPFWVGFTVSTGG